MVLLCKASLDRKYFHISLHWKTAVTFPYFMFVKFIRGSEAEEVRQRTWPALSVKIILLDKHAVEAERPCFFMNSVCIVRVRLREKRTDAVTSWRKPSAVNLTNDLLTP